MKNHTWIEILGRLRRDIGRLDALLAIIDEVEDEAVRERLESTEKLIIRNRKPLLADLNRIEKGLTE